MKRKPVERDLLALVAREYYMNGLSQQEIGDLPNIKKQQSTIGQWLKRAQDLGIISIDIDPNFGIAGKESSHLRDRMKDAFELDDCLVVEPDSGSRRGRNDDSHIAVANRTGSRLIDWFQSRDHVLIAGGRAVLQVARFLERRARPRRDMRISPMSGRIWTGVWQVGDEAHLQRSLDADDAASLLALAYKHEAGTRVSQIGASLYPPLDRAQLHETLAENCAFLPGGRWNWSLGTADKAIVGLGVLKRGSGHRIAEFLKGDGAGPRHLRLVANEFKQLIDLASDLRIDVGDLGNRLFPALPFPNEKLIRANNVDKSYAKLVEQSEALNNKAVIVEWSHLKQIRSVWAISAGEMKKRVAWTVLLAGMLDQRRRRDRLVNQISVDDATAHALLQAKEIYDASAKGIRDTYASLSNMLFPS